MLAPSPLRDALETLARLYLEYGRVKALAIVFEPRIAEKLRATQQLLDLFDAPKRLQDHLAAYHGATSPPVGWSAARRRDGRFRRGSLALPDLVEAANDLEAAIAGEKRRLRAALDPLTGGEDLRILAHLPEFQGDGSAALDLSPSPGGEIRRAVRAPSRAPLDPIFRPSYAVMSDENPHFSDDLATCARYLWTTAMREAMACNLCLITLAEYDGLPLAFYLDLARQAADEARHAAFFLRTALGFVDELAQSDETWADLQRRAASGQAALDVPREGDFYSAIWAADLRARLVLMHADTEGPAVGGLVRRLSSPLCQAREALRTGFQYVIRDEITHAKLGKRWLKHLEHDTSLLTVDETRLLRGLLLATSVEGGDLLPSSVKSRARPESAPLAQ